MQSAAHVWRAIDISLNEEMSRKGISMKGLRPKWIVPIAGFLLRRSWGRKLLTKAAERFIEQKLKYALNSIRRGTIYLLISTVYFVIGLVDSTLHPTDAVRA
jgi:hypothetical protein